MRTHRIFSDLKHTYLVDAISIERAPYLEKTLPIDTVKQKLTTQGGTRSNSAENS